MLFWPGYIWGIIHINPSSNGTPNSSQVIKIKTCIGGFSNDTAKSSQLARNHSIVWIRPRSNIKITKQLGESWLALAEVAKRRKTWLELGAENLSLIKFKPTRSNSSQVGGQTIPNSSQVVNFSRVGLSWEFQSIATMFPRVIQYPMSGRPMSICKVDFVKSVLLESFY